MSERLYQPGADRMASKDGITNAAYGPIPEPTDGEFWTGARYEQPVSVDGWAWSNDYGCWRALVTFANGWRGFTSPRTF